MLKKLGVLSIATASLMAMHTAELNINNVDLEAGVRLDMGQFNDAVEPDTTFVGFKYLKSDEDHSDIKEDIDSYFEANFLMQREINNSGFYFGLGVKLNFTSADKYDFVSIPVGAEVKYNINVIEYLPMYVGGSFYYAPQVLSLQDAKNFMEFRAFFDVEVIKNGKITLGFRKLDTDYDIENGDVNYNQSGYIGFKFDF
jgi:hypothetical protein